MDYFDNIGQEPNFKVGDKVKRVDVSDSVILRANKVYTVTEIEYDIEDDAWYVALEELSAFYGCETYASRFEKAN